jgi:hypothetical protein
MEDVIDLEGEESGFEEDDEDCCENENEKDTDAISGDLPEPDEVLRKRPELANDPRWANYLIGSDDGDIGSDASSLTLSEAEAREYGTMKESTSVGRESAEDSGRGEAHDLATVAAAEYGEEVAGEYIDKHDEWLAATRDWTFGEIRSVLYEEASDSAFMGGGPMRVAGWCRCGATQI